MPSFELSKWYADCVTEQGDALILYSAELRWHGPSIHYTSLLTRYGGRPVRSRFSLRQLPPPEVRDGGIGWKSRAWKTEGRWDRRGSGIREVLFDSPAGSVEWDCVAPRSSARLQAGEEQFRGWGYVEHLRLSLPPWRLPINQLRWGRFINATDALVWIDWRGPYNQQVVYYNGAAVGARKIGDDEIALADSDAVLSLDVPITLREGPIGATALAVLSNKLFPARIVNLREQKWLSRAVLRRPSRPDSTGMAIHEVVEWP